MFVVREKYSTGHLELPMPDDEQFADQATAERKAIANSGADDGVWGVWENKVGELLAIAYLNTIFKP